MPFNIDIGQQVKSSSKWSVPRCGICGLYKHCNSPKMPITGKGKRKILIIGEAPGRNEDEQNAQFVGDSGKLLNEVLEENNINMRRDCWLDNAIRCRPENNRTPTSDEISYCKPNVTNTIRKTKPNVIVTVGRAGLESVLSGIWGEDIGPIGRWVGWKIPSIDLNAWIIPTWHPSFINREVRESKMGTPIRTVFSNHLAQLNDLDLDNRPYDVVPNYEEQIEIITDTNDAAKIIWKFVKDGGPIAFDYETECLKPDIGGKIYTAAVCWRGERTIAFPWYGVAMLDAWSALMKSDCPKFGHNIKFEDRWTRNQKKVAHEKGSPYMKVNNWVHDTMVGAHLEDCRRGICSLAFQTFVNLGVGDYSSSMHKFLVQKHSYKPNNIKQVNLRKLLLYNGLDALMTYLLAVKQMKYLRIKI